MLDPAAEQVASLLREIVRAVDQGRLSAVTPLERRLLLRIEGAVVALETVGSEPQHGYGPSHRGR